MSFNINLDYDSVTDHYPNHQARPIIGITGNFGENGCTLGEGYYKSLEAAGAIPVVLPPTQNITEILTLLDRVDGILLSGGADINPLYLDTDPIPELHSINPERDRFELLLTRFAFDRQIPMLGICRGMQVLAAALGGSLHQDIRVALPDAPLLKHSQDAPRYLPTHFVEAEADSTISSLLGSRFAVNSFHHQAVNEAGPHLRVVARSADGVVEAVESNEEKSIIGVQWHPECFIQNGDESMLPLFRWFMTQAESFRRARKVHQQILTLDSHTDTPMFFEQGVNFDHRDPKVLVDLHKLHEGMIDSVIMVAYLKQEGRSTSELEAATCKAQRILQEIRDMVENVRGAEIAYTPKDAHRLKSIGRKAIFLGIENGYAIGRDLTNIARFRNEGVVYMTLCHNGDNDICDAASRSNNEHNGLSDFGKQVVDEMNRVGMMVDLSHAGEKSFYDVLSYSQLPPVCSHSSSRALCNHPRNLTDEQLRALADKGGVAQVTFYHGFLREDGQATISDVVAHLLHMIDVAGIDHVGIGSDFDGDGGVPGLASEAEMLNLTRRLINEGLTNAQLRKIWGGNFLRVMNQWQKIY